MNPVYSVEVKEQAKEDLLKATIWYEAQSKGLGDRFLREFKRLSNDIVKNPLGFER